jgi:hypothetical protein
MADGLVQSKFPCPRAGRRHLRYAAETDLMNPEADVSPPARLWRHPDDVSPPLPQWIKDVWIQRGRPSVPAGESFGPDGQALLWFVANWYSTRVPYRFGLPTELLTWLNTTEVDVTRQISSRPGLRGEIPCTAFKPITRFMRSVWEQRGRAPMPDNADPYYDFLAEFAFAALPTSCAPAALLPREIVELLNAPAADEELPLTVGMLLYIKRSWPDEFRKLHRHPRERLLALSFKALEGLLAIGDPRLIPAPVSAFWSQRPLPGQDATAFEYVAVSALYDRKGDQIDGKTIRNSFNADAILTNPGALLLSGPPADLPAIAMPETRIEDRHLSRSRDYRRAQQSRREHGLSFTRNRFAGLRPSLFAESRKA